ncbi:MAG: AraC family transcriptional regulator [Cyclobacteriaceae bacterium]
MKQEGFEGQRSVTVPKIILDEMRDSVLHQQLHITDIGYYPSAENHQRERINGCDQHILIYCAQGEGWLSIDGHRKIIRKNKYFIIPKNHPHSYGSSIKQPWTIYWVHFSGAISNEFTHKQHHIATIPPSSESRIQERIELFEEMLKNLEMGFSTEIVNYANICLLHFLGSFKYVDQFRVIKKFDNSDIVEKSILIMRENLNKNITLDSISKDLKLSPSHFSLRFKKKTGRSPIDYLLKLRIQMACRFLDHSSLKVKEIAQKVGIADQYYFSRLFKKNMGCSPQQYRKHPKG